MSEIQFNEGECWDGFYGEVIFYGKTGGDEKRIRVSSQALRDRFNAATSEKEDLLKAFRENRSRIEKIAERLIEGQRYEPDGTILIRKENVQQ